MVRFFVSTRRFLGLPLHDSIFPSFSAFPFFPFKYFYPHFPRFFRSPPPFFHFFPLFPPPFSRYFCYFSFSYSPTFFITWVYCSAHLWQLSSQAVPSWMHPALSELESAVRDDKVNHKNTAILLEAQLAVRALCGGRVTFCKSGKVG